VFSKQSINGFIVFISSSKMRNRLAKKNKSQQKKNHDQTIILQEF